MKLSEFQFEDDGCVFDFYKEIWEDNEYSRFGIEVKPGDVVVDYGANIGLFSQYAISKGASQVYSFELQDKYFKYLNLNTISTPNIEIYQGKVTDRVSDWNLPKILSTIVKGGRINFLKVDIEGWEYATLINCPDEYLKCVDKIAIETHFNFGRGMERTFNMMEKLSKCGFRLSYEQIHKNSSLGMVYGVRDLI
jgi:tRNA G37 N-methylase Trm5